jgi:hypothetical protein
MVDPLLTALRIISIFFFSATEKRRRLISTLVNHLREVIFRREFGWI